MPPRPSVSASRTESIVYPSVGRCIYCGSNDSPLGREHINPLGLDGGHIMLGASCSTCSKVTAAVEQQTLRGMFGLFREQIGLRSNRHKGQKPQFRIRLRNGRAVATGAAGLPQFLIMPLFQTPSVLLTGAPRTLPLVVQSHRTFRLQNASPEVVDLYGPFSVDRPYNIESFARMLAKIAHSLAVATLGDENFESYLTPVILGTDLSYVGSVIGQIPGFVLEWGRRLHDFSVRILRLPTADIGSGEYVTVHLRLFSAYSDVTYSVVVGRLRPTKTYLKWAGLKALNADELAEVKEFYRLG